jgi:PTS system galactitol-specific IIA component
MMSWTQPDLVQINLQADDSSAVIRALGGLLLAQEFVHDTFIDAVLEREKIFATGLPTPEIQVAIPHADVEHVKRASIAVGVLAAPVAFGEMGNPDGTVDVRIACCLAVKESDSLVLLLQNLVGIFQDTDFLRQILAQDKAEDVADLFNARLPAYQEE